MSKKNEGKSSFVLYFDLRTPLELLSDEEKGRLFTAIFDYAEYGRMPEFDGALQMAFAFIKNTLDRDSEKWEDVRERRREAGSKGGKQAQAKRANACFAEQSEANEAVSVSGTVKVPVNAPVPDSGSVKTDQSATQLTEEEFNAFCNSLGIPADKAAHYRSYAKGRNWKEYVTRFWNEDKQKYKPPEANGKQADFVPGPQEQAYYKMVREKRKASV